MRITMWVFIIILVCFALGAAVRNTPPSAEEVAAKAVSEHQFQLAAAGGRGIHDRMRDPDSLVVSQATVMADSTVCYSYRARNGFGGMNSGQAVALGGLLVVLNTDNHFHTVWSAHCTGKTGVDKTEGVNFALTH